MSEASNSVNFRVIGVSGDFNIEDLHDSAVINIDLFLSEGKVTNMEAYNPAKGLYKEPLVATSGFGQYSSARTIEELQGAVPATPGLFWWLFTLVSVYPDVTTISFTISSAVWGCYLETNNKKVYAWVAESGKRDTYVIEKVKEEVSSNPAMNPSEVMQAFSVCAEHIRMGSDTFSVRSFPESEGAAQFIVSLFDHDNRALRYDVNFTKMLAEPKTDTLH